MSEATADMIVHYRVKLGGVWLHAVGIGEQEAVRNRLGNGDQIWHRTNVELVACKPLDAWSGPFPKGTAIKMWLSEDE